MASNDRDGVAVTDESFGELLIEGLREAVSVARGEQEPGRRNTRPIPDDRDGLRA